MKLLNLQADSYRRFDRLDFTVPSGVVAVLGRNGSGKSSLVRLPELVLFGSRSLSDFLSWGGAEDMTIACEFEHGGERFRIRRGYTARGTGKTTLDFEAWGDWQTEGMGDGWHPLTRHSQVGTQALIEERIGFTRETFRNSAYLAQKDGSFADERWTGAQRKQLFFEALALGRWERYREAAHTRLRAAEDELQRIAGRMEAAETALATKPALDERARSLVARAFDAEKVLAEDEWKLGLLDETLAKAEKSRAELATAEAELRAAEEKHGRLHEIETDAQIARQSLHPALELLESLPTPPELDALEEAARAIRDECGLHVKATEAHQASQREWEHAQARQSALVASANGMRQKAGDLRAKANDLEATPSADEKRCELCTAILDDERRASTIANWRTEADELDAAAADVDVQVAGVALPEIVPAPEGEPPNEALAEATEKLRDAREKAVQAGALRERIGNLQQKISDAHDPDFLDGYDLAVQDVRDAKSDVDMLRGCVPSGEEVGQLLLAVGTARDQVAIGRASLDEIRNEKLRLDVELERLAQIEAEVAEERERRGALLSRLDVLTRLEQGYGRNGIPALILENTVPRIEHEADRIVQLLGRAYRFEIRTQREKKAGGLADTLDVVIHTEAGSAPYASFSGSEQVRIDLALRIGLARVLGAEIDCLILDEPEGLDEEARAQLPEMLQSLAGEFATVLLVTQYEDLAEAFEVCVRLEGGGETGEPSRIVSDAPAELVTA